MLWMRVHSDVLNNLHQNQIQNFASPQTKDSTIHQTQKNSLLKFLSVKYQHINIFLTCSNVPKQTYFFLIIRHYYFFSLLNFPSTEKTVHNICCCVYNVIKENKYSLSMNIIFILYHSIMIQMRKGSKYPLTDNANAHAHKQSVKGEMVI